MTAPTPRTPAATAALKARATRRPTGLPSWPILLIAGAEKSGKSWSSAQASGSDLVGRTLWIGIGEDDPDEYAHVPGADFEIVEHDGTYRDILAAIQWAVAQAPAVEGKPNLLVVDSMTRLWDLLCDMAQAEADDQARRKAAKQNRAAPDEADITMNLWNIAKGRWQNVIDALREHHGPVLLTARLEEVAVIVNGRPVEGAKALKVKAEKSLPYDVGGIVQMPERGKAYLVGVRSTRLQVERAMELPKFTVDGLWRRLGLHEVSIGDRRHARVDANDTLGAASNGVEAEAMRIARDALAANTPDRVLELRREAAGADALTVNIAPALTAQIAQHTGLGQPPVTLDAWLTVVTNYVDANGGLSVADGVADQTGAAA